MYKFSTAHEQEAAVQAWRIAMKMNITANFESTVLRGKPLSHRWLPNYCQEASKERCSSQSAIPWCRSKQCTLGSPVCHLAGPSPKTWKDGFQCHLQNWCCPLEHLRYPAFKHKVCQINIASCKRDTWWLARLPCMLVHAHEHTWNCTNCLTDFLWLHLQVWSSVLQTAEIAASTQNWQGHV